MNAHGRRFVRGKTLEDDLRSVIVDTILHKAILHALRQTRMVRPLYK